MIASATVSCPLVAEWLGFPIDRIGLSLPSDGEPDAEPATEEVAR